MTDSRTFTINTGDNADNPGQYGNANLVVTGNVLIGKTLQTSASYNSTLMAMPGLTK